MSTKIGPFEVLSELAKSPCGAVYKANDAEGSQTVALKVIQLDVFGDHSQEVEKALLAEAESTKVLSSVNITPVFGAGEIEGKYCAAMEYIQGNSIATMLARKEGFSIWDLLDIGRQLCGALDHTASKNISHYSLEPGKIMCGWDGTVRILGYGVSAGGNYAHYVHEGLPLCLHYMSPEQVRGEAIDIRSNLFSLGAMFYEMVTERKAFDRDDIEGLRQSIQESTPVAPIQVNPKVHPMLSSLIMKALSKDPAERYPTGRELLDDLEKCKESKTLAAKKPEAGKGTMAPAKAQAAAQSKFIASNAAKPAAPKPPVAAKPAAPPSGLAKPAAPALSGLARPSGPARPEPRFTQPQESKPQAAPVAEAPKAAAAAASAGSYAAPPSFSNGGELDLSDQFFASTVKATIASAEAPSARMSAASAEPEVAEPPKFGSFDSQSDSFGSQFGSGTIELEPAEEAPKFAVDPMMAEGGAAKGGSVSFSEMTELPPLKEVYVAPPPSAPTMEEAAPAVPRATMYDGSDPAKKEEKPKIQPREVAEKAIKEIKGVPPKLMAYAIGGALALILAIGVGVTFYIHGQNDDDTTTARPAATEPAPAPEVESHPAPAKEVTQEAPKAEEIDPAPVATPKSHTAPRKKTAAAPVVIPGQLSIDSTPQGAQVQIDGHTAANWITPLNLTNLGPGQHAIVVSKPGYSTDSRTVEIASGAKVTTVAHLSQLMATLIVKSDPPGAGIFIDGRDAGAKTPAQVSVDKGQHVVLVRMMGYIDETMNAQFVLGQTFNFAPTLRALGNTDNIKTVGKMSKLFGGKGAAAGQATLSIRTQPKGAQVAINQHIMDKNSPLDVALDPGNYVIDITLTGYQTIHKVITADKGGKVVVDEVMQRE